MIQSRH